MPSKANRIVSIGSFVTVIGQGIASKNRAKLPLYAYIIIYIYYYYYLWYSIDRTLTILPKVTIRKSLPHNDLACFYYTLV